MTEKRRRGGEGGGARGRGKGGGGIVIYPLPRLSSLSHALFITQQKHCCTCTSDTATRKTNNNNKTIQYRNLGNSLKRMTVGGKKKKIQLGSSRFSPFSIYSTSLQDLIVIQGE